MYKMLVLDMDGTLLNESQQISKQNKKAIVEILDKGIKVVLATGRPYSGVVPFCKELGIYEVGCYSITCSGALVVENVTKNVLYEEHILQEDLTKIHNLCEEFDIDMSGYTKDMILIHHENLFSRYDALANFTDLKIVDFCHLEDEQRVYKLNIINESLDVRRRMIDYFPTIKLDNYEMRHKEKFNNSLFDELWRFPQEIFDHYTIVRPLPFCIELLGKNSNKAVGVRKVAEKLGIEMSEIICIGDSGNDVHMIEEVGLGVAMANASQEAKNVADEITLSNEENGVAVIIDKYFLDK